MARQPDLRSTLGRTQGLCRGSTSVSVGRDGGKEKGAPLEGSALSQSAPERTTAPSAYAGEPEMVIRGPASDGAILLSATQKLRTPPKATRCNPSIANRVDSMQQKKWPVARSLPDLEVSKLREQTILANVARYSLLMADRP